MINHRPHHLKTIPDNGILILPLAPTKLDDQLSPIRIYSFLRDFGKRQAPERKAIDVVLLYGKGSHFNSPLQMQDLSSRPPCKALQHAAELKNLVLSQGEFNPRAIHFASWDFMILSSLNFSKLYTRLERHLHADDVFQRLIAMDIRERGLTSDATQTILQELVVSHSIRQKFTNLPQSLSKGDSAWRLIVYPGNGLRSDFYISKKRLLPLNSAITPADVFTRSFYNWKSQSLANFDHMELVLQQPTLKDRTLGCLASHR